MSENFPNNRHFSGRMAIGLGRRGGELFSNIYTLMYLHVHISTESDRQRIGRLIWFGLVCIGNAQTSTPILESFDHVPPT